MATCAILYSAISNGNTATGWWCNLSLLNNKICISGVGASAVPCIDSTVVLFGVCLISLCGYYLDSRCDVGSVLIKIWNGKRWLCKACCQICAVWPSAGLRSNLVLASGCRVATKLVIPFAWGDHGWVAADLSTASSLLACVIICDVYNFP